MDALAIVATRDSPFGAQASLTPSLIRLAGRTGDLRTLTAVEGALKSGDATTRAVSLATLAALGDFRALGDAREARSDPDVRVRLAAAEVLVRLGDPDAARTVAELIGRDDSVLPALELSRDVQGDAVTRALVERVSSTERPQVREAALGALGRQVGAAAVAALVEFMRNPKLERASLCALARSPSAAVVSALETLATRAETRRNAIRAYFVRTIVRGEESPRLDVAVQALAQSDDARDRAVAVQALVAFGRRSLLLALADRDPRVRRAAALGSLLRLDAASARVVLARRQIEPDAVTREVLSNGLALGDPEAMISTQSLFDVARAGRADSLLAVGALVRRLAGRDLEEVTPFDEQPDAVMREQVARALSENPYGDAVGRLVGAYRFESDARVRRAIIGSLVRRLGPGHSAEAVRVLATAAQLDPDARVRTLAASPAWGESRVESHGREVACLGAVPGDGGSLRADMTGTLVDAEGTVVSFAFDDDGYALVPGLATGDLIVRLAPAVGPYEAHDP
jgi:hypothetical protein